MRGMRVGGGVTFKFGDWFLSFQAQAEVTSAR